MVAEINSMRLPVTSPMKIDIVFIETARRFSRFALPAPNSIDNHAPMQDTSDSIGLHFPRFAISAFKPADRK